MKNSFSVSLQLHLETVAN